ncbi:hypothetical protein BK127_19645 [Paenibacillus sp. FSL H7-0331]|nr:hypothetical protein BK127_19645 [Paenibacillus sp. FSL H7-0331]
MKWKFVNAMLRKAEALIDERVSQLNYLREAAALGSVSVGCFAQQSQHRRSRSQHLNFLHNELPHDSESAASFV